MDLSEKLHQFVRSIEGFIFPEQGKAKQRFISRTELFLGNKLNDFSRELFNLRSIIEHLHGPYFLEKGKPNRAYRLHVCQRGLEAEALARHCICNFLLNEKLWPHFEDDSKIELFWKLPESTKRDLWGATFDLKQVSSGFRMQVIDDSDLLL